MFIGTINKMKFIKKYYKKHKKTFQQVKILTSLAQWVGYLVGYS